MPQPRTSDARRAHRDRLPDVEISATAPRILVRSDWLASTQAVARAFAKSEPAKSIRPSEVHLVRRYFDCVDRETRLFDDFEADTDPKSARATLVNVHTLHRMVLSLGREIGISPLARRNLGVPAENLPAPGDRLADFNANRGEFADLG